MLVGERIKLRPFEEHDLAFLVEWWNRPRVWENFFNKFPLSHGGQANWYRGLMQNRGCLFLMIETVDGRKSIGTIGLDRMDHVNQSAEYGNLAIGDEKSRGMGFAKEATHLLLEYGFDRLNLNRIFLHVLAENVRALELYRKCGFSEEGRLRQAFFDKGAFRDILMMSVLRDDYHGTKRRG